MKSIITGMILISLSVLLYASGDYDSVIYTKESNIAVEGYDPVSFFQENNPIKGSQTWSTEYRGAAWYFSSEENLNLFTNNPNKYAPAYGGYCAWAMNEGKLAPGKPKHWDIIEGRLYLNYSSSTRKKFLADLDSMISTADTKWPEIKFQLAKKGTE
jgi:YHS domain-containing protein